MSNQRIIADYTHSEFIELIKNIFQENTKETDNLLDLLLDRFEELTEHPLGTDLIYYPESPEDGTPERITEIVKEWRESQGLPCFKD